MDRQEIQRRVDSFDRWHYEFDLDGVKTSIHDPTRVNRHRQRKAYFFDPLVELMGGSLEGKRVLDLGSNAGYWSLAAIEAGADFVFGIDGRQMHVDQANLVFEVKAIEPKRYEFAVGNIFDFDFEELGRFDVVLCLGLMYHISKHMDLMEIIDAVNDDVLLIDTKISRTYGSYLKLHKENTASARNAVDFELVMWPSRHAVYDLASQFGYEVVTLKPRFTDWTGSQAYREAGRRAFLCAKKSDLSRLSAPLESHRRKPRWGDVRRFSLRPLQRLVNRLR